MEHPRFRNKPSIWVSDTTPRLGQAESYVLLDYLVLHQSVVCVTSLAMKSFKLVLRRLWRTDVLATFAIVGALAVLENLTRSEGLNPR